MVTKTRVLVFCRYYLPGFRGGGPVRSLFNLVQALAGDVDFRIVTLDRDVGSAAPYPSVRPGSWQHVEGAEVLYLTRSAVSISRIVREVGKVSPQLIYLNSLFDPVFTLRYLLARRARLCSAVPVLLAPQGELSAGALRLKVWKKTTYLRLARVVGLHRGLTWQASSENERKDILGVMKTVPAERVRVVSDLADAPMVPVRRAAPSANGELRLCFLSRVTPMKNLDFALQVLAVVKAAVVFTIYGPLEDEAYWKKCEQLIALLPTNIRVVYGGEVHPADVRRTLAEHDLFLLPTRGENFGHVIYEALSAGVPVLISDRTPWSGLEEHGAGWNVPLESLAEFGLKIEAASRVPTMQRAAIAQQAMAYAAKRADRSATVRRIHELLLGLIPR